MTRLTQFYTTTFLCTFLTGSAALADVTALQVWDDWQGLLGRTDTTASFDQSITDGILTINNLTLTGKNSRDENYTINLGSLVFQEQGDGSVAVLLPNDAPIVVTSKAEKLTLNQTHKDLSLVIRGSENDLTYSYSAQNLVLKLVELIKDGEKVDGLEGVITLTGLSGSTHSQAAALHKIEQDISIKSITYSTKFAPSIMEADGVMDGELRGFYATLNLAIPKDMKGANFKDVVEAGFFVDGDFGYDHISTNFKFEEPDDKVDMTLSMEDGKFSIDTGISDDILMNVSQQMSSGPIAMHIKTDGLTNSDQARIDLNLAQLSGGFMTVIPNVSNPDLTFEKLAQEALDNGFSLAANLGFGGLVADIDITENDETVIGSVKIATAKLDLKLNQQTIAYEAASRDINIAVEVSKMPVGPMIFAASEVSTKFAFPISVTDKPMPFIYLDRYIDLTVSDNVTKMFDPKGLLPLGVMTYILDISGTANWLENPFDKTQMATAGLKGEIHSLDLNQLQVTGAGLNITGKGGFTFDNTDLKTFSGIPAPTGAVDLKIVGFNKLLDTLVSIGLIKDDQLFPVRMGLGMLTVVGDGEDTLVSHIETTDDGHILANGKRLK